jgi:hypothetical protein
MLTVIRRMPGTARFHPRSGDKAAHLQQTLRAEIVQLNTRVLALEREQHVQFERMAQMQQQLDELTRLVKALAEPVPRRKR